MREYFRNARVIYNEARRALDLSEKRESSLLSNFRDWRSRLSNADFTVSNERLFLRNPAQLDSDPALFLRLFEFVARHGIPLAAETERRLETAREAFARFCARRQTAVAGASKASCRSRTQRWPCEPCTIPACCKFCFPNGTPSLAW